MKYFSSLVINTVATSAFVVESYEGWEKVKKDRVSHEKQDKRKAQNKLVVHGPGLKWDIISWVDPH